MAQKLKTKNRDRQRLYIGTSGWSYQHWKDRFYPKSIQPKQYLEFYSKQFNCVEVNVSFYRLPQVEIIKTWFKNVPNHFIFSAKMSRVVTHFKKLNNVEQPLQLFFNNFSLLKNKLGPILIQLPPQLTFDRDRVENFFQHLKQHYHSHRFALEGRHLSWLEDNALELMHRYKIALVLSDYNQPIDWQTLTTDFIYLRFHGPEQMYASKYSPQYLQKAAKKIKVWLKEGKVVWVFFNNDADAFAIENALELEKFIEHLK